MSYILPTIWIAGLFLIVIHIQLYSELLINSFIFNTWKNVFTRQGFYKLFREISSATIPLLIDSNLGNIYSWHGNYLLWYNCHHKSLCNIFSNAFRKDVDESRLIILRRKILLINKQKCKTNKKTKLYTPKKTWYVIIR